MILQQTDTSIDVAGCVVEIPWDDNSCIKHGNAFLILDCRHFCSNNIFVNNNNLLYCTVLYCIRIRNSMIDQNLTHWISKLILKVRWNGLQSSRVQYDMIWCDMIWYNIILWYRWYDSTKTTQNSWPNKSKRVCWQLGNSYSLFCIVETQPVSVSQILTS